MTESEILTEVANLLAQFLDEPAVLKDLRLQTRLQDDLALSSVHYIDLLLALERRFDIMLDDAEIFGLETVSDWVSLIQQKVKAGSELQGSTPATTS